MNKLYLLVLSILVISSCENEITLTSPSELTASGFWESEDGALAAHSGLYGTLRGDAYTLFLMGEMRSDIWGGQTFESPFNLDFIQSNFTVTTAPFSAWAGIYTNIYRVNDFLANVPDIQFQNEEDKQHILGQAYGLRALYYYTLLKNWGPVPITTEPEVGTDPAGLSKARSSEQEVMELIKSDIQQSLDAFGTDNSFWNGNKNYWSKAATLTLKGEVFLWSGNLLGGGNADFTEAKNALEEVSTLSLSLEPAYANLWGIDNENNDEFIFAIQYEQDQATNFFSLMTGRTTEIHPQFTSEGESMDGFIVDGANRYGPSEKTLQLTDDEEDSRKKETFIRLYTDGNGYPQYNADKYFGSVINKFGGRVDGSIRIHDGDIPFYRYADVLLLLAEAKNHLGEDPSVEINMIRERAYADNYNPAEHAYSNGSMEENTRAILNERYKEFIGEGKRWWDLRRAGDNYVIENVEFLEPGEEYKLKLPITLDMIGRNPLLEQTAGWN